LIEFRTRKAHRWVVRDKDLLKYLLGMVLVVFGYMAAWTVTNLNFIQENYDVLTVGTTYEGLQFLACKALWWDYVTETGTLQSACLITLYLQRKISVRRQCTYSLMRLRTGPKG
jgi:hypothetical protein